MSGCGSKCGCSSQGSGAIVVNGNYTYQAWATDENGSDFSLVPLQGDGTKYPYTALITSNKIINPLTAEDFEDRWFSTGGTVDLSGYLPLVLPSLTAVELNSFPFAIYQNVFGQNNLKRYGIVFDDGEMSFQSGDFNMTFQEDKGFRLQSGVWGYVKVIDGSLIVDPIKYSHFRYDLSNDTILSFPPDLRQQNSNCTFIIEIAQKGVAGNTLSFNTDNVNVEYISLDVNPELDSITEFWCRYDFYKDTVFINSVKGFKKL